MNSLNCLKIEELFNGTLGTWKIYPVDFEIKEDMKPICSIPYPVPKVHKEMFNNYAECLFIIGFIERANGLEWGFPSFVQLKPKTN